MAEFDTNDLSVHLQIFRQLKEKCFQEGGQKSQLEKLKENLGGSALEEVAFIYQRMNKKSDQTKIKALETMLELLKQKNEAFFMSLMPSWTVIHDKLMISEIDPAIHAGALEVNRYIITTAKKAMKTNFRSFYPSWFLTLQDFFEATAAKAQENLDLLIPERSKQNLGFYLCQDNFLGMVTSFLTETKSQFKEINIYLDDDECERVQNRVLQLTISSLDRSLKLMSQIPPEDVQSGDQNGEELSNQHMLDYYAKVVELLDLNDKAKPSENLIETLFNNKTLSALIRSKLASLFKTLLDLGIMTADSQNGFKLIKMFLFCIDAREPKLQEVLWKEGLLMKCVDAAIKKFASIDQGKIEKGLISLMQNAGFGLGEIYYSGVVKFVKEIPLHKLDMKAIPIDSKVNDFLKNTNKVILKKAEFAKNVLEAFTKSLGLSEIKFLVNPHLDCLFEILGYLIFEEFFVILEWINSADLSAPEHEKAKKTQQTLIQTVEMTIQGLFIVPLNVFIQENIPDQKSLHVIGVNNPKFIPGAYLRFLDLISKRSDYKLKVENYMDIIKGSFKAFSDGVQKTFKKNQKNFENFIFLIDSFGQKEIEDSIISQMIKELFDDCFSFATNFVKKELSLESCVEMEENFDEKNFGSFLIFLSNFLGSSNTITTQVCKKGVPVIFESVIANLMSLVNDDFELFDSQSTHIKIIKFLFECLHLIVFWLIDTYQEQDAFLAKSLAKVDTLYRTIYSKVIVDFEEAVSGRNPADLWLKINQKASEFALITLSILPSTESKFFLVKQFQEATSSNAKLDEELPGLYSSRNSIITAKAKKNLFKILKKVPHFEKSVNTLCTVYLYSQSFQGQLFSKIFEIFSTQLKPEITSQGYEILLKELRQEDTYLASKLSHLDGLLHLYDFSSLTSIFNLIISYVLHSKDFSSNQVLSTLETALYGLSKENFNSFLGTLILLVQEFGTTSAVQLKSADKKLFDKLHVESMEKGKFLLKMLQYTFDVGYSEDFIQKEQAEEWLNNIFKLERLSRLLDQGYYWRFFVVAISSIGQILDLKEYFSLKFQTVQDQLNKGETHSAEIQLFQILSSCIGTLSVVLDHELKNFYVGFVSKNILPLFTSLAEKNLPQFLAYLSTTINQALSSDDKLVIGLSKILSAVSGSEIFTDSDSETNLIVEVLSILSNFQKEKQQTQEFNFNSFLKINDSLLASIHRNNYKLPSTVIYSATIIEELMLDKLDFESSPNQKLTYLIKLNKVLLLASGNKDIKIPQEKIKDQLFGIINLSKQQATQDEFSPDAIFSDEIKLYQNAIVGLFFKYINNLIESQQLELIVDYIKEIEAFYNFGMQLVKESGEFSTELLVVLLEFLRKVVAVLEMFSENFQSSIMNTVFSVSLEQVGKLSTIKNNGIDVAEKTDCGYNTLVVEIAETLTRFCVSLKREMSEDRLLHLLSCDVPVIQKAAFILMKYYYETIGSDNKNFKDVIEAHMKQTESSDDFNIYEVSVETFENLAKGRVGLVEKYIELFDKYSGEVISKYAQNFKKTKKRQTGMESDLEQINRGLKKDLSQSFYGYILTWIVIMHKLSNIKEDQNLELRLYNQYLKSNPGVYFGLLNSIFSWILNLGIGEKDMAKLFSKLNFTQENISWTEYLDQDTALEVLLFTFYKFCSMYPRFLRNWSDVCDKRYLDVATGIIQDHISEALFNNQVEIIEVNQPCKTQPIDLLLILRVGK